ncbi:MAG: pilus assembly PilX N-terminal domain-containing protein [Fibrobacteraceae bacterium]|nr:pilus assembly PilX N-terminal domain-containing protein [Fibrobacteraceae bacterium]
MFNKRGVSLVTVLLFMLVATIAATATYKWITSENKSSTSRMLQSEAYQAANAGINSARSWMIYNANDVGGAVRQFLKGKKPILLNTQIGKKSDDKRNQLNKDDQKYSVWLVGVDTRKTFYNLKVVSVGEARNGSKHSEVAVFKVDGLYRVNLPVKATDATVNYDRSFFGVLSRATSSPNLNSAMINGDYTGNIPNVEENFLVTGNVKLEGASPNSKLAGGNFYAGGNVGVDAMITIGTPSKDPEKQNVAYIGGNLTNCPGGDISFTVYGDVYINGDVAENCGFDVTGNVTINGKHHIGTKSINVGGSLVYTENAEMLIEHDNFRLFSAKNIILPKKISLGNGKNDNFGNHKANFEKIYTYSNYGFVFCSPNGDQNGAYSDYPYGLYRSCEELTNNGRVYNKTENRYFSINRNSDGIIGATFENNSVSKGILGEHYWEQRAKMDKEGEVIKDKKVAQPILISNKTEIVNKYANDYCKIDPGVGEQNNTSVFWTKLNQCYDRAKADQDGLKYLIGSKKGSDNTISTYGFMVYHFNGSDFQNMSQNTPARLSGNYIFHITGDRMSDFYLPPTTDDAVVMIYVEAPGKLYGTHDAYEKHNYFVYGAKDIELYGTKINGSILMENEGRTEPAKAYIGDAGVDLEYNATVINTLASAGIIKGNEAFNQKTDVHFDVTDGSLDDYHISVSPQLRVKIESQYENSEIDVESLVKEEGAGTKVYSELKPSVITLPRVIYLPKDPYGKLKDYYKVQGLNGAITENLTVSEDVCTGDGGKTIPGNRLNDNLLYVRGTDDFIEEGVYTCTIKTTSYEDVPLYVVVKGESRTTPIVAFKDRQLELASNEDIKEVYLTVTETENTLIKTVDISIPIDPGDKWSIVPSSNVQLRSGSDGRKVYTVTIPPQTKEFKVFTVSAPQETEANSVTFLLEACNGCLPGVPQICNVAINGFVKVVRHELSEYCSGTTKIGDPACNNIDVFMSRPECDDIANGYTWVGADGNSCSTLEANNKWSCRTGNPISLVDRTNGNDVEKYCDVRIADYTIEYPTSEHEGNYVLFASLRKKQFYLNIYIDAKDDGSPKVYVKKIVNGSAEPFLTCNSNDDSNCKNVPIYANEKLEFTYELNGSKFNYWFYEMDGFERDTLYHDTLNQVIAGNLDVTAVFDKPDEHCIYESFTNFCVGSATEHCIDNDCVRNGNYSNNDYHCNLNNGKIPAMDYSATGKTASMWYSMYHSSTDKDDATTCIKYGSGAIVCEPEGNKNPNSQSGNSNLIVNKKKAGPNGTLDAVFETNLVSLQNSKNTFLNSGFIFRVDEKANTYNSVNIFGNSANNNYLMARLCFLEGSGAGNNGNGCAVAYFKDASNSSIPISAETMLSMAMRVQGNDLHITVRGSGFSGDVSFKLNTDPSWPCSNKKDCPSIQSNLESEYLGFKLSDAGFKIYSFGWVSDKYENDCIDVPRLECSMAAEYLGGRVPKNEEVNPWVRPNTILGEKCKMENIEYYYNACDVESGYFENTSSVLTFSNGTEYKNRTCANNEDYYMYAGWKMKNNTYKFTYDGEHGYSDAVVNSDVGFSFSGGYHRNVYVRCKYEGEQYITASCGKFYVGGYTSCVENLSMSTGGVSCSKEKACEISVGTSNVREAFIHIDIGSNVDFSVDDVVTMYLVDENGKHSVEKQITQKGNTIFYVNDLAHIDGFNPETIKKVVLYSSTVNYTVNSIMSACPNDVNLSWCKAKYSARSGKWYVTNSITSVDKTSQNGCSIYVDGVPKNQYDCSNPGNYEVTGVTSVSPRFEMTVTTPSKTLSKVLCANEIENDENIEVTCSLSAENCVEAPGTATFKASTTSSKSMNLLVDGSSVGSFNGTHIASELGAGNHVFRVYVDGMEKCSKNLEVKETGACSGQTPQTPPSSGVSASSCTFDPNPVVRGTNTKFTVSGLSRDLNSNESLRLYIGNSAVGSDMSAGNLNVDNIATKDYSATNNFYVKLIVGGTEQSDNVCFGTLTVNEPQTPVYPTSASSCAFSASSIIFGNSTTFAMTGLTHKKDGETYTLVLYDDNSSSSTYVLSSGNSGSYTAIVNPSEVTAETKYSYKVTSDKQTEAVCAGSDALMVKPKLKVSCENGTANKVTGNSSANNVTFKFTVENNYDNVGFVLHYKDADDKNKLPTGTCESFTVNNNNKYSCSINSGKGNKGTIKFWVTNGGDTSSGSLCDGTITVQ